MDTLIDTRAVVAGALLASTAFAAALTECRYAVCAPQFVRDHNKTINKRNSSGRWTFVKKVLSSAFLGALLTSGSAVIAAGSVADPAVGTWKLNLAKSTFAGIPAYKSQTRVYSRSGQDITLKMTTVSAEGKETTTRATYKLNGKDYPSMGNPDFDSLSGVQIDTSTVEFTLKRAGKPIGKIRRAVSKDGQTLTINYVITNANGVQTSALTVFDKQ
ncbi:MAG TPA: hypothetical protein VEN29_05570 [Casimicrobiaceae bacterium]|nr:hypothetical protein [Casimicrobiaceae bacterium]